MSARWNEASKSFLPTKCRSARISVVIPAYNASAYLKVALESVVAQSFKASEIIVVDDGSTDDTIAVAQSFEARVISEPNRGPSAARNSGTQIASGEYIAYLDADDFWAPEKLANQLAALDGFAESAFSFTDYRLFDANGFYRCRSELRRRATFRRVARKIRGNKTDLLIRADTGRPTLYESYVLPSAIMVRRADVLAVGGFDESLRVTEDFEFCLRLLRLVPAIVVMKPLLFYRQHPGQATANAPLMLEGYFDVARRVVQTPERYPAGDAAYIAATNNLRLYRLGLQQARLGQLDAAVDSFERSLASRPVFSVRLALIAARLFRSGIGRSVFIGLRKVWKSRPGHR